MPELISNAPGSEEEIHTDASQKNTKAAEVTDITAGPFSPQVPTVNWPDFPVFTLPAQTAPAASYYSQVRFLNAASGRQNLDIYIDNPQVLSGSGFGMVSPYMKVSDGFHTITIRRGNGPVLFQQTLAFISGEKATFVILDTPGGVTLTKVSDMGCTNVPSGYGCFRAANMSYNGSSYDVRMFNNQVIFSDIGYKEVTSFKQAAAGSHTFFVTNAQFPVAAFRELPIILLSALAGSCPACAVNNPLLSFSLNVEAGKAYTSYIIGNPWSGTLRVLTTED